MTEHIEARPSNGVRLTFSEPCAKLFEALAKAQAKINNPPRNREVTVTSKRTGGKYTFKYSTLDKIIEHVRQPLTDNGLWFIQNLEEGAGGRFRLITHLVHSSGQWVRGETPILAEDGGNQAFGSALTYMRRYSLTAMLGIAADEDDDANTADGNDVAAKPPPRTTVKRGNGKEDAPVEKKITLQWADGKTREFPMTARGALDALGALEDACQVNDQHWHVNASLMRQLAEKVPHAQGDKDKATLSERIKALIETHENVMAAG